MLETPSKIKMKLKNDGFQKETIPGAYFQVPSQTLGGYIHPFLTEPRFWEVSGANARKFRHAESWGVILGKFLQPNRQLVTPNW